MTDSKYPNMQRVGLDISEILRDGAIGDYVFAPKIEKFLSQAVRVYGQSLDKHLKNMERENNAPRLAFARYFRQDSLCLETIAKNAEN